ncbi:MAG: hypothetical protein GX112_02840 [Clostridiaceae bacterium]|jgi:hypothetical protein|nr:hypothetical protein [Clostridiaceae bacterium]
MKSPLTYLLLMRLKNQVLSWLKSPAKLIYLLFIAAMLAMVVFSGQANPAMPQDRRDIHELTAGLFALYLLLYVLLAQRGFGQGASLFRLADVNLIFAAPFRPRSVLFFGLVQQMGQSLLLGVFLLYQFAWMRQLYGVSLPTLLVILLGYALTVFSAQLTAMVLYSLTSGDDKRHTVFKVAFYGLLVAYGGYVLTRLLADPDHVLDALVTAGNSTVTRLVPVAGWVGAFVAGFAMQDRLLAVSGIAACLAYLVLLVVTVMRARQDFYEDVLLTTESNHNAITARKEGRLEDAAPRRVRLGRVGLNKGSGAAAFYYKHVVENRRSRVLLLSGQSLVFIVTVLAVSFFMQDIGLLGMFAFSSYIQIFSVAMGRLNRELLKPYIYLVPDPPFAKLLHSLRESLRSHVTEAVVLFVPLALLLRISPLNCALCILARVSYAYLFTSGNLLTERIFGAGTSKVLTFFFYFLILTLLALPGIVLAIMAGTVTGALLALLGANIPMALLVFFLCRNILQTAEFNNR